MTGLAVVNMLSAHTRRVAALSFAATLLFAGSVQAASSDLPAAAPASVGFSAERLNLLDAGIKELIATGHIPGATTFLARHGRVVLFNTYGKADLATGAPVTKDTIFRIYSMTKPVTGVAMMILFEEGKWRLDDPVTKYAPELASLRVYKGQNPDGTPILVNADRPPTMREMMTHTAGFAYGLWAENPIDKIYAESGLFSSQSSGEFLAKVGKLPLADQPGAGWRYSAAADIQGYIVERLSGMSLADFLRTRIFEPLKMNDTAFAVPPEKISRLAALYDYGGGGGHYKAPTGVLVRDYSVPPVIASGGAGLVSTTMDYARFLQMLLGGGELDGVRILAPATVKLMEADHLSDAVRASRTSSYTTASGLGFGLDFEVITDTAKAGTLTGEGTVRWSGAAGTWFWIDPKNDVIFVGMIQVMNRRDDPQLSLLEQQSATFVYQALTDPGVAMPPAALQGGRVLHHRARAKHNTNLHN